MHVYVKACVKMSKNQTSNFVFQYRNLIVHFNDISVYVYLSKSIRKAKKKRKIKREISYFNLSKLIECFCVIYFYFSFSFLDENF